MQQTQGNQFDFNRIQVENEKILNSITEVSGELQNLEHNY